MSLDFLVKGLLLGFVIAIPVGPIGIFCLRKTVQYGKRAGLLAALGATLGDTLYAIIATCGLTSISHFLIAGQGYLRLIGGIGLLYLGGKLVASKQLLLAPAYVPMQSRDWSSTFLLTLANPATIFFFLSVLTSLGVPSSNVQGLQFVSGLFLGSSFLWLLMVESVARLCQHINPQVMTWVNRCVGLLLLGFGVITLLRVAQL